MYDHPLGFAFARRICLICAATCLFLVQPSLAAPSTATKITTADKPPQKQTDKEKALDTELIEKLNKQGAKLVSEEKYAEALQLALQLEKLLPNDAMVHLNKGMILSDLDRHEEAIQSFDRAIEIQADFEDAYEEKISVLQDLGRFPEALKAIDQLIEINGDNAVAWVSRTWLLNEKGDHVAASEAADRAIELLEVGESSAFLMNEKGYALMKLSRCQQAMLFFEQALTHTPNYKRALINKASCLFRSRDYQAARQVTDQILQQMPEDPILLQNKAFALLKLKEYTQARSVCTEVIDQQAGIQADDFDCLKIRGASYMFEEDYPKALEDYEAALTISSSDQEIRELKEMTLKQMFADKLEK